MFGCIFEFGCGDGVLMCEFVVLGWFFIVIDFDEYCVGCLCRVLFDVCVEVVDVMCYLFDVEVVVGNIFFYVMMLILWCLFFYGCWNEVVLFM